MVCHAGDEEYARAIPSFRAAQSPGSRPRDRRSAPPLTLAHVPAPASRRGLERGAPATRSAYLPRTRDASRPSPSSLDERQGCVPVDQTVGQWVSAGKNQATATPTHTSTAPRPIQNATLTCRRVCPSNRAILSLPPERITAPSVFLHVACQPRRARLPRHRRCAGYQHARRRKSRTWAL